MLLLYKLAATVHFLGILKLYVFFSNKLLNSLIHPFKCLWVKHSVLRIPNLRNICPNIMTITLRQSTQNLARSQYLLTTVVTGVHGSRSFPIPCRYIISGKGVNHVGVCWRKLIGSLLLECKCQSVGTNCLTMDPKLRMDRGLQYHGQNTNITNTQLPCLLQQTSTLLQQTSTSTPTGMTQLMFSNRHLSD